jgi:hypothetical protein
MYFKCDDCGIMVGHSKSKVGNDLLLMSRSHFFYMLVSALSKDCEKSEISINTLEEGICPHHNIVRVIQLPKALVKMSVTRIEKYTILPIVFNESTAKRVSSKDEAMVADLFRQLLI